MISLKATGKLGIPGPETNGQKADKSNFLGRSGMLFYGNVGSFFLAPRPAVEKQPSFRGL
jgi:hypothetical protein